MNLILAQGAEHTNPDRLKQIIRTINDQRMNLNITDIEGSEYIEGKYGVITNYTFRNVDYVTEEKFDGFSYLCSGGRFFSKRLSTAKGNEGAPVEKTGHIPHLAATMQRIYECTGADLHGEIYIPGGVSDDMSKFLGCDEGECIDRIRKFWEIDKEARIPHYMLVDIRRYQGKPVISEPYWVRRALLEHVYNSWINRTASDRTVHLAPVLFGDPNEHFKRIVTSGGEGVIFKKTSALYIPGKKPADNWIKGKKKITHDVVIMGYNEGTGKNAQMFGSIRFGHYVGGKLVECGNCSSGLDDATRAKIAVDPGSYIGTVMEIEAIQESAKSFRNAVFLRLRDDKGPEECIASDIRIKDSLI